jgi:type VI secretion system protein ImpC
MRNRFDILLSGTVPATSHVPVEAPQTGFHILVLGDFSGGRPAPSAPQRIDLDTIDHALARFSARIEMDLDSGRWIIEPRAMSDLEPDALIRLPWFTRLRELRTRLQNTGDFPAAARELIALENPANPGPPSAAPSPETESPQQLMERLLGPRPPMASPVPSPASSPAAALIRQAAEGSVAGVNAAEQADAIARVDRLIAEQMRALLHRPEFQRLEAAWRGLDFLVHRLELGEEAVLHGVDMSRPALAAAAASGELAALVSRTRCHAVAALHEFGTSEEDLALLAAGADGATRSGALFLAGLDRAATAELAGATEIAWPAWNQLRQTPAARRLILTAPRWLLRLPYGAKTSPVEQFAFEEMPAPRAEDYLWGHGALLGVCALAEEFIENGVIRPQLRRDMEGLPLHIYREDGESKMTPCAELWLSDGQAGRFDAAGVSALQSKAGVDAVVVNLRPVAPDAR